MKRNRLPLFVMAFIAAILLLVGLNTAPTTVHAAPLETVTNLNDSGAGSLRQAIADVDPGGTIEFAISGTIVLASQLVIDKNMTIQSSVPITISGNNAVRVFFVNFGTSVTLDNLTIANGRVNSGNGGGIDNRGTLTVINSTISGNYAPGAGGGLRNNASGARMTVINSTIISNTAGVRGGGLDMHSDSGTCADTPSVIVRNSTFSGNSAGGGGGGGLANFHGVMEITHSTITGNSATNGGGIWSNRNDPCTLIGNTIIAGNNNNDIAANSTDEPLISLGYNLIGTAGSNVDLAVEFDEPGDMINIVAPLLGSLADNGGSTQTHALLPGSPAIDAGDCTSGPATDQRGVARPQDDTCDIGAYEETGTLQCGVTAGNSYAFPAQLGVSILVNSESDLDCLYVDRLPFNHPRATGLTDGANLRTGQYWLIRGLQADGITPATTFNVDLTLPYATASGTTRACKWLENPTPATGFGWNCEDGVMGTSFVLNSSITREGVTAFSQWAVGDGVGPTAVTNLQADATSPAGQGWLVGLLVGLLGVSTAVFLHRRPARS